MTPTPEPGEPVSFEHLFRLSDDTGLFEHARGCLPRREHGYCVDDVARGLVVISRAPDPSPALAALADRYLAFVSHALGPDGTCHNRLGYDRRWEDQRGTGDWWGRALWGLGSVVAGSGARRQRDEALDRFTLAAGARSLWPRATAFGALGAAQVLRAVPGDPAATTVLRAALTLGRPGPADGWPWPEARLSYANAAWAEALIAAGAALDDGDAVADGLRLLGWLVDAQTDGGHLSPVPHCGWGPGEPRPGFDQQPIEVAALADACVRAHAVTGDGGWLQVSAGCMAWFLGDNDAATPMHDPATGGGLDGLEAGGANRNQGAESTLAWLMVQLANR
ncbi:hypothetical protein K6U06_00430 [Acidiferrimicrobium sp. IK]|uniref:hypothetical protein n=1 Tax=Acidiferrimicrobium sp. IK TaxID=2871700 RepID=UPI0021CB675D|nr:hypothetical protein [Acidiferrimicrobium sp. IK]MCU4182813.1 hypothetical protein [Acidiferrimicrobium sp. IK]